MDLETNLEEGMDTLTLNEDVDNTVSTAEPSSLTDIGVVRDSKLQQILMSAIEKRASDLHLTASYPPTLRIDGNIGNMDAPPMVPDDVLRIFQSITTKEQRYAFQRQLELDFFCVLPGLARLRVNTCLQQD